MLAAAPAVAQDVRIGAACIFEGICQNRQAVEGTFVVNGICKASDSAGTPGGIEEDGMEGVAEDIAEQLRLRQGSS